MLTRTVDALRPVETTSAPIAAVVEAAIEGAILEQQLPEGTPLTEADLAAALGVSRSPVRDALKRLAHKGLVESRGRRGFSVVAFSPDQITDFFSIREVLEGLAARLAAERIRDDELAGLRRHLDHAERELASKRALGYPAAAEDFHGMVARAARSPQFDAAMEPIQARVRLLRRRSGAVKERARQALAEHRAIFSAIERRDADEAEVLMRAHIRMARANLLTGVSTDPGRDANPRIANSGIANSGIADSGIADWGPASPGPRGPAA